MVDLIRRLKKAGVHFEAGMTAAGLDRAEECFGFRFPKEIRAFLMLAVPVGKDFFDYRDLSEENGNRFRRFQASIVKSFRFDLKNNREDLLELLGQRLGFDQDSGALDDAVMKYLDQSVRLIPFYAHRCFFDGMDDMPIVSFWQPVDTIVYGGNLEHYLKHEFPVEDGGEDGFDAFSWEALKERLKSTGIWGELIE